MKVSRSISIYIFALAALALTSPPALSQLTSVSGTVKGSDGVPYAGGLMKMQLVTTAGSPVTGQPTVTNNNQNQCVSAGLGSAPCQMPFQGTVPQFALSSTGGYNITLQDNTQVTPAATQWLFTVSLSPGAPPPLGTGPQVCTFQSTISGASQNVSIGTCPALSAAGGAGGTGGTGGIVPSGLTPWKACFDGSVTNGSPNISSAGQCQWTSSDVHKKIFVTNICNSSQCDFTFESTAISILPSTQTTIAEIASVTDATHIVADCLAPGNCVSPNSTQTLLGAAAIFYGLDNTTSLNNAYAAGTNTAGCPTVQLPQGIFGFNQPIFTTIPFGASLNACQGNVANIHNLAQASQYLGGGGAAVNGQGQNATALLPTPDFTNPGASTSCVGGVENSTYSNFSILGFGQSQLGSGGGNLCSNLFTCFACQMSNMSLHGWAARTGVVGALFQSFSQAFHVEVFGFGGQNGCQVAGGPVIFTQVDCGTASGSTSGSSLNVAGTLQSSSSVFTLGNPANQPQIDVTGVWQSVGDQLQVINGINTAASDDIKIENGGVAMITNMTNNNFGANDNGIEVVAGGKLFLQNYRNIGSPTPNRSLLNAGSVFDQCGNVFTGPVSSTGSYFGSCSTTGTACTTGNWALTSGWGTSTIASVTAGGDSHRCQVVITGAAGAAGPVLTWTFPSAYVSAPGSCQISFNGTLTGESTGAPSTTSVAFTFNGTPSAQTYRLDASCGP